MIAAIAPVPLKQAAPIDEACALVRERGVEEPRLLFLTHTGRIGGAEMCLLAVAPAFDGEVLLFEDGPLRERLLAEGARVSLPPGPRLDLRAIRRDRGLLHVVPRLVGVSRLVLHIARRASGFDLLYCNSQKSFVLGALASCLTRTTLVWHLHDILDASHFASAQIRLVIALANRRAACVLAPSRAVADAFAAAGGRPGLVSIVHNGVAADPRPATSRQALGLPAGFLFGVFSRLAPWKGQHVALQALALLPDAACVIAGDALFGEASYACDLRRQAEALGLSGRVHFLGQRDDVPALMRAVDVVVHPSIHPEPFGLTLVEAMLAGTPVVASDAGAAGEILDGGRAGALVPPGDAQALAEAIAQCRLRPEAVARQVAVACRRAEQEFSVERLRTGLRRILFAQRAAGSFGHLASTGLR